MFQEIFTIPGTHITIYGYGVMLVIGFLLSTQLAGFLARRARLNPDTFVNVALLGLFTGVIGARLSHVIEDWSDYTRPNLTFLQNFYKAVNLREGGLTYYGGFLLAFPCLVLYGWFKRIPIKLGMDIIAPCLMVGLAFGRVGCFLNGCCYGAECDLPWAVQFPYGSDAYYSEAAAGNLKQPVPTDLQMDPQADPRPIPKAVARTRVPESRLAQLHSNSLHPAQLYSTITALMIAGICVAMFSMVHVNGRVFALMCMLEGPTRFILELLRAEPKQIGPFTLSEFIGIGVFVIGVVLWIVFGLRKSLNQGGQPVVAPSMPIEKPAMT